MNALRNFRIGTRLRLAFASLLAALCVVAGFGILQTSKINDNVVDMGENWTTSIQLLGELRAVANEILRNSLRVVLEDDPVVKAAVIEHGHAIADLANDAHFMGDQHDGDPERAVQRLEQAQDGERGLRVERRSGLVGQQQGRLIDQCARNPAALFLAAR